MRKVKPYMSDRKFSDKGYFVSRNWRRPRRCRKKQKAQDGS